MALVIAPNQDYHWYRLNADGTWSHKPGSEPVTNRDASDKIIIDSKKADRDTSHCYGKGAPNYTEFIGYFEVSRCSNEN